MVPKKVIDTFKLWNELYYDEEYDERMCIALLLVCLREEDLQMGTVDNDVRSFIRGVYIFEYLVFIFLRLWTTFYFIVILIPNVYVFLKIFWRCEQQAMIIV